MKVLVLVVFFLSTLSFFLWSFTLTDPNLYFSTHPVFMQFQNTMWEVGQDRTLIATWFVVNAIFMFGLYFPLWRKRSFDFWRIRQTAQEMVKTRGVIVALILASYVLLLSSNPALSHDIYNYIFNAKAVIVYGKDPHVFSALEVAPNDTWTRFMHNTHTPAPYGYVWTIFSLVPFIGGLGKFLTTFLAFKMFAVLGLGLLVWQQRVLLTRLRPQNDGVQSLLVFALSPLVLIEVLSNGHNDAWMMALYCASLVLLTKIKRVFSLGGFVSALFFILSTQIKLATLVLFPIWILFFIRYAKLRQYVPKVWARYEEWLWAHWAELSVVLLFIPLITDRSQQFHPWYLIWPLSFLPFVRLRIVRIVLLAFSLTSLLRYIPFLLVGEYSELLLLQSKLITWSALLSIPLYFLYDYFYSGNQMSSKRT